MLRINHDFRGQSRGAKDPALQAAIDRLAKEVAEINELPKIIETAPNQFERVLTLPFVPWVPVDYRDDWVGCPALPMGLTAADMLEGKGFFPGTMPRWAALPNKWTTGALKWSVLRLSPEEIRALRAAIKGGGALEAESAFLGIRTAQRTPDRSPTDKTAATCFLLDSWFDFDRLGGVGIWGYQP